MSPDPSPRASKGAPSAAIQIFSRNHHSTLARQHPHPGRAPAGSGESTLGPHHVSPDTALTRDVEVVEVWFGDRLIATIVPSLDDMAAVTIVSKHLDPGNAIIDMAQEPPTILIPFAGVEGG